MSLGVRLADADGSFLRTVGPSSGSFMVPLGTWPSIPRWSPDGTRIAVVEGRGISIFDLTGRRTRHVGPPAAAAWLDEDTLIVEEATV